MEVLKAIIPAAGLGTRFLPLTKAVAKEMIPLLQKPAIHYIVEEALASQVHDIIMVTSKGKDSLLDYFDRSPCLESILKERNQEHLLTGINRINRQTQFSYVRQSEALGLGHAVWLARKYIGAKEYCSVLLPDDIILDDQPTLQQLIRIARQEKASVIAVQEVPTDQVSQYGIIGIKKQITPNLFHVGSLLEKPAPKDAPSRLGIIGRYILSPKIFSAIEAISDTPEEIQLTTAIDYMLRMNERVFAYKIPGRRFDIGTPLGWTKAVISIALQEPTVAPQLRSFLRDLDTYEGLFETKTPDLKQKTAL